MGVRRDTIFDFANLIKNVWNITVFSGCMQETSLIVQFASSELSGVAFQMILFISKRIKLIAQICNLIYLYTELYQRKIFD